MKVSSVKARRLTHTKGDELENQFLMGDLMAGRLEETTWTRHATERLGEMVKAGFNPEHIRKAVTSPESVHWSDRYGQPYTRYKDVSVAFMADDFGDAIVVTVLPCGAEAWEQFRNALPDSPGRERRKPGAN